MQYQVPQFLDVEDKIVGSFTMKEFIYIVGGIGGAYISYRFIPYVGVFVGLGCVGLAWALAFYKFNNKPFIVLLENAFNYYVGSKMYTWHRKSEKVETTFDLGNFQPTKSLGKLAVPMVASSKLDDLTWGVDIKQAGAVDTQKPGSESAVI